MKKVLIVTYYWPPAGGPGVQRVLKFVKYLYKYGWEPLVLTVKEGEYPAKDETLIKNVPKECKIYRTEYFDPTRIYKKFVGMKEDDNIPVAVLTEKNPSLKKKISNFIRLNFFVPDAKICWIRKGISEGIKIIESEKPDLIFSSSPPPTVHLIAKELADKYNLKWAADFRDPWTDIHYYENQPRLKIAEKKDKQLERAVLKRADRVICISSLDIEHDFSLKTDPEKCVYIPNGYDEDDFSGLKLDNINTEKLRILHLGAINRERVPYNFLLAIRKLYEEGEITLENFSITFVGKVEQILKEEVEKNKLKKFVNFVPYLPHSEALKYIENSNMLLLLITQSEKNKRILPGKTFEYIRSKREILALGPTVGEVAKIINSTNSGKVINYEDYKSIYEYLRTKIGEIKSSSFKFVESKNIENYSRENLTKELVKVFDELVNESNKK